MYNYNVEFSQEKTTYNNILIIIKVWGNNELCFENKFFKIGDDKFLSSDTYQGTTKFKDIITFLITNNFVTRSYLYNGSHTPIYQLQLTSKSLLMVL